MKVRIGILEVIASGLKAVGTEDEGALRMCGITGIDLFRPLGSPIGTRRMDPMKNRN